MFTDLLKLKGGFDRAKAHEWPGAQEEPVQFGLDLETKARLSPQQLAEFEFWSSCEKQNFAVQGSESFPVRRVRGL